MRNFIMLICGIIFGGLLIGSLAACSAPPAGDDAASARIVITPSQEEPEDKSEIQAAPSTEATEPLPEEARDAYAGLLREVLDRQALPDGTLLDCAGTETLNWNDFALCDLNGDGIAELVLNWVNSSLAGQMEVVFTYDRAAGEIRELLRADPGTVFYSNGAAESPWSRNQGLAARFWPYDLYQLQKDSGVYKAIGAADAWEKEYHPQDFSGKAFPDAVDSDGDGLLYYLLPGDWRDAEDSSFYDSPIDGPEYERWRTQYTGGAEVLTLDFLALTEENLNAALHSDGPYGIPSGLIQNSLPPEYIQAVEAYCRDGILPDGQDSGGIPNEISYAVFDVDGDGADELLIRNTQTITAGQTERVYNFDGQGFREELQAFPELIYYSNGLIQSPWSHNQGKAGSFWPYTLYQYDPEKGSYQTAGSVDAWDKSLTDEGFPKNTDADGDGFVYYLLPPDWNGTCGAPVDGPAYEAWRDGLLSGAVPLEIPWKTLEIKTIFPNAVG